MVDMITAVRGHDAAAAEPGAAGGLDHDGHVWTWLDVRGAGRSWSDRRTLGLPDLAQLMDAVPAISAVPTVDELEDALSALADEHPDAARWRRIGTSRAGDPLHVLSIGAAGPAAVVVGGLRATDQVGGVAALHLARTLLDDPQLRHRLGYSWHLVGCADPDGARLDQEWLGSFAGRSVPARYEPPLDEQVARTFPVSTETAWFDRVLPETQALMRLVDETRPTFVGALHGIDAGGVAYGLSEEATRLEQVLREVSTHVGLTLGESGTKLPAAAGEDRAGTTLGAYAARWDALTLDLEVPRRHDPDAADVSATDVPYAQVLADAAVGLADLHATLKGLLLAVDEHSRLHTPFLRAVRRIAADLPRQVEDAAQRAMSAPDRPSTVAEAFVRAADLHRRRTRCSGMLLRHLQAEVDAGVARRELRLHRDLVAAQHDAWVSAAEASTSARVTPLRDLVALQLGAVLAAADYALHVD